MRNDLMKRHYCSVLFEMCKTRRLQDIGATEFIAEAQTARQTFYNHFSDMNDLIFYAGMRLMIVDDAGMYSLENSRKTLQSCVDNASFYCQLPGLVSQNNYRQTLLGWLKEKSYACFIDDAMPEREKEYRMARIDAYHAGTVEIIMNWLFSGMKGSIDVIIDVLEDSAPSFVRERRGR